MLNAPFTATNGLLHLHNYSGPPELVMWQVQGLLLTLVSSILVTSIHDSNLMTHGDHKLQNFSQFTSLCVVMVEGSLVECQLFSTLKGYCCITFFHRLTTILVIALLKAIAEAMSNNRELSRVFHQIISANLKVITSVLLYCIRPSRYFHSS